jgi:CRP/FNR family transcriptional regulator, dissimilatory nitrate respiration regulator
MENFFIELAKTNIFKGLTEDAIAELLKNKPFQLRKFEKDKYIACSQDPCNDMLIVVQGSVRGEMTDFTGKRLKIEDIVSPRPLAIAFIFGSNNRFPVDIIANELSVVAVFPRDVLIYLLQHSQVVLNNYLNAISSRTQFLSNKIKFLSFKTIKEKIANYMLSQISGESKMVRLRQTQSELADFFGVTRPSLARALSEMEKDGLLSINRKEITILNKENLNKLVPH